MNSSWFRDMVYLASYIVEYGVDPNESMRNLEGIYEQILAIEEGWA